jgi:23S rRNA pseudouridine2604 synthase
MLCGPQIVDHTMTTRPKLGLPSKSDSPTASDRDPARKPVRNSTAKSRTLSRNTTQVAPPTKATKPRSARPGEDSRARPPRRDGDERPSRGASSERPPRKDFGDRAPRTDRPARAPAGDAPRREWSPRPDGDSRPPRKDFGDRAPRTDRPAPRAKPAAALRPATPWEERDMDKRGRVKAAPRDDDADSAKDGIRVSRYLADRGAASRREADDWIVRGWVTVDGETAVLGQRVLPHQKVDVHKEARIEQAQRVTVLMHKPVGYVSGQAEDGHEPASVLFLPENQWMGDTSGQRFNRNHLRGLAPAGRLDIDSHGLLVLTQDGRVARTLIGEDSTIEKEYLVRVRATTPFGSGALSESFPAESMALLNHGLELDGEPLKPAKVSWQNEEQMRFVLREGKKRQIRRMCEAVGLEVVALKRVRIGRIPLSDLPVGKWRYLRNDEAF